MNVDRIVTNPREHALEVIARLPGDATWEDIAYEVHFCGKIAAGLKDVEAGRVVSHEEAGRRLGLVPS